MQNASISSDGNDELSENDGELTACEIQASIQPHVATLGRLLGKEPYHGVVNITEKLKPTVE